MFRAEMQNETAMLASADSLAASYTRQFNVCRKDIFIAMSVVIH